MVPACRAGLAGVRLGYCAAHSDLVNVMMAIKQPYNVNTAAEAAGLAALKHRDAILATVASLRAEKDRLFSSLQQVGRSNSVGTWMLVMLKWLAAFAV